MAQIAVVNEPVTIGTIQTVQPIPVGPLIDVGDVTSIVGLTSTVSNRFPIPPSAAAFLTDVDALANEPLRFDHLMTPYILVGAVAPTGSFLEPTIGQIWPRTG
jgi:hypothetical protein